MLKNVLMFMKCHRVASMQLNWVRQIRHKSYWCLVLVVPTNSPFPLIVLKSTPGLLLMLFTARGVEGTPVAVPEARV